MGTHGHGLRARPRDICESARRMGVRVVEYAGYATTRYRVQKRGWFGVFWTQATYLVKEVAIAAAERLVRGEPLHAAPPSPVVWP